MTLSQRLRYIVDFVPQNSIVADIGTDHGYIPVYLIENKISKKVIGTDISPNSLKKIAKYVSLKEMGEFIDIRLGNGLSVIKPFEIDTVIIAGMGGLLIRDILKENKDVVDSITHFILQPNIASDELRKFLYDNNFVILKEKLAKENNKFYEIIYARRGISYLKNKIYLKIGEKLIANNDPLLIDFINEKISIAENIMKKLKGNNSLRSRERYLELKKDIDNLKAVLREIESN